MTAGPDGGPGAPNRVALNRGRPQVVVNAGPANPSPTPGSSTDGEV